MVRLKHPVGRFQITTEGRLVVKRAFLEEDRRRLAAEAAALGRLSGLGGIIALHSWDGETLKTQKIDGCLLGQWRGGQTERRQVARALVRIVGQVHARGVAHRDLSPSNILIDDKQKPWLLDFELARMPGYAEDGGTPGFFAPELRWLPSPQLLDRRADLFSLGILLRWLWNGTPRGMTGEALLQTMMAEEPEGQGIEAWLGALRSPHRERRPTALDALEAVLEGEVLPVGAGEVAAFPTALVGVLENLEEEVPPSSFAKIREDLVTLVPLDGLAEEVQAADWSHWAQQLGRAHALRERGEETEQWEVAALEMGAGIPWRIVKEETGCWLPVLLDGPGLLLGRPQPQRPDSVRIALEAAAFGRVGRVEDAALAVSAALRSRPENPVALEIYWSALARAHCATGSATDLVVLVTLLPKEERGTAIFCLLPALNERLGVLRRSHALRRRQAQGLERGVDLALGTTRKEVALVMAELAIWAMAAGFAEPLVCECLQRAGENIVEVAPDDPCGAVLVEVAVCLKAGAIGTKPASTRRGPNTTEPRALAAWLKKALAVPKVQLPAWAGEASSGGGDTRGTMALVARQGVDAALVALYPQLQKTPRDARLWTLVLQLAATRIGEKGTRAFLSLVEALEEAGLPAPVLLPWRMRAWLLAGEAMLGIETLVVASRRFVVPWPAWWVAAECWLAVGNREKIQEAVVWMRRAGAPLEIIEAEEKRLNR